MDVSTKLYEITEKIYNDAILTLGKLESILNVFYLNEWHANDEKKEDQRYALIAAAENFCAEAKRQMDECAEMAAALRSLINGRSLPERFAAGIDRLNRSDWDVMVFLVDAVDTVTEKEALQIGLERFGASRAPSEATIESFYLAMSQYKGDRVMGQAGTANGAAPH